MPNNNMILYAKWKINKPNIDLYIPETSCIQGTGVPGATIEATNTNTIINSTVVNDDGTFNICNIDPDIEKDIEITQSKDENKSEAVELFTVSFDTQSDETPNYPTIYIEYGKLIKQPIDPIKTGNTFLQWFNTDRFASKIWYFDTNLMPRENIILTADYNINRYVVNYYDDNGFKVLSQQVEYGKKLLNVSLPKRIGYEFDGWSITNGNNTNLWNFDTQNMPANDVDLFAKWSINSYNITFDYQVSKVGLVKSKYDFGTKIIAPESIENQGYTFRGWNTKPDGTGMMWNFAVNTVLDSDMTLYAIWDTNDYRVTYNYYNGENIETQYRYVKYGDKLEKLIPPKRYGYEFSGWSVDKTFYYYWDFANDTMIASDITLNAMYEEVEFEISYDYNHNSLVNDNPVKGKYLSLINPPREVTRFGYHIIGWNTMADGNGKYIEFGEDKITKSMYIYAIWAPNVHKVTFMDNPSYTIDVNYNDRINVKSTPRRDGYTLVGWSEDQLGNTLWDFEKQKMPNNNVVLYPIWKINTYNIRYFRNDETASIYKQEEVVFNSEIMNPGIPKRNGYTFSGWNERADGSDTQFEITNTLMPARNLDLYAMWTANDYEVTFDSNDGQGLLNTILVKYKNLVNKPVDLYREGYTFANWNTMQDGSGRVWNFNEDLMQDENITLYAQWNVNNYSVEFDLNGGNINNNSSQQIDFNEYILEPKNPTKDGNTFTGWQLEGTNKLWDFATNKMPASNIKLVAKWDINEYTMTFDQNYNDVKTTYTYKYDTVVVANAEPTRNGYNFNGWNTNADATGFYWNFDKDRMPAKDTILYADWVPLEYKVSFDNEGNIFNEHYFTDKLLNEPLKPSKSGYEFIGWQTSEGKTWDFARDVMPPMDITLYAKFGINIHDVSFDLNGAPGVVPSMQNVEFDGLISEPVAPEYKGHTFAGWMLDENSNWNFMNDKMPNNSLKLTAKWLKNQYNVTYYLNTKERALYVNDTYNHGDLVTQPDIPRRLGYKFIGWAINSPTGELVDFNNFVIDDSDYQLFAIWERVPYTINFDLNYQNAPLYISLQKYFGESISKPKDPKRNMYEFVKWNIDLNGAKNSFDFKNETVQENDITLYAEWKLSDPIIDRFDENEKCLYGEGVPNGQINVVDQNQVNIGNTNINEDGSFVLCNINVDNVDEIEISQNIDGETSNVVKMYAAKFNTKGARTVTPKTQLLKTNDLVKRPNDPEKNHNKFIKWNLKDALNFDFNTYRMVNKNILIEANWQLDTPVVDPYIPGSTCITGSGQPNTQTNINDVNGEIINSTNSDVNGIFKICDIDPEEYPTIIIDQVDENSKSETVTMYSVTFDDMSEESEDPKAQYLFSTDLVSRPADPTKKYNYFKGWINNDDKSMFDFNNDRVNDTNIHLVGNWELLPVEIDKFNPDNNCLSGFGEPDATINIYNEDGNLVATTTVNKDGTFEVCDLDPKVEGELIVDQSNENSTSEPIVLFTVIFDPNGGQCTKCENLYVAEYTLLNKVIPTKANNEFNGWFVDGVMWNFNNDRVTKSIRLVAEWDVTLQSEGCKNCDSTQSENKEHNKVQNRSDNKATLTATGTYETELIVLGVMLIIFGLLFIKLWQE